MKRLIVVYNPRSTRFPEVEREVLEKARKLQGWMVLKFEVEHRPVEEEAKRLKEIIRKGDLVLAVGGDGTAGMVLNAIMESGKLATMGVLPFGNFNDFAATVEEPSFTQIIKRFMEGKYTEFYPLEVRVDGRRLAYAGMYLTVGMLAEAAELFEGEKVRKKLGKVKSRLSYAAKVTFFWYMKNKKRRDFLRKLKALGGLTKEEIERGEVTDYVAMNGRSMAGVVEAEGWFREPRQFRRGVMKNRKLWRLLKVFVETVEGEMPGEDIEEEVIEFMKGEGEVWVNFDGEARKLKGVTEVRVRKTGEGLRVIEK
ncbi:hypothetical protein IJI72_03025 [Candidatus Saccharibacteria bacterium]|nr:hypothetical protein [Candidatus Saccharibacteria bacterium]